MRAAVYKGEQVLQVEEIPDPTPSAGQVVMRVKYSAICGTDVHAFMYDLAQPGAVMGHEYTGTIVDVGPGVSRWQVGRPGGRRRRTSPARRRVGDADASPLQLPHHGVSAAMPGPGAMPSTCCWTNGNRRRCPLTLPTNRLRCANPAPLPSTPSACPTSSWATPRWCWAPGRLACCVCRRRGRPARPRSSCRSRRRVAPRRQGCWAPTPCSIPLTPTLKPV